MKIILHLLVVASFLSGCRVVADQPISSDIIVVPASPGPGFIYINDSWRWNRQARTYSGSKGHWVQPRNSAVWVDGHWRETRGGWKYVKGHWK